MSQGKCLKDWTGNRPTVTHCCLPRRSKASFYLCVIVQSLRLISLIVKQLSQFSQHAAVGGADADDVHQPLNGPLGIFQKLVYGATELRAVGDPETGQR